MNAKFNPKDPVLLEEQKQCIPVFKAYFLDSLRQMYDAENQISIAFNNIKDRITSPELQQVLDDHYTIHLKHLQRIERIFKLLEETMEGTTCEAVNAIVREGIKNIQIFVDNTLNTEVALMLTSQKLTHYKIGAYAGLAYLAIRLNYTDAATFLAISVQEEEEFADNKLRGVIEEFLSLIAKGEK